MTGSYTGLDVQLPLAALPSGPPLVARSILVPFEPWPVLVGPDGRGVGPELDVRPNGPSGGGARGDDADTPRPRGPERSPGKEGGGDTAQPPRPARRGEARCCQLAVALHRIQVITPTYPDRDAREEDQGFDEVRLDFVAVGDRMVPTVQTKKWPDAVPYVSMNGTTPAQYPNLPVARLLEGFECEGRLDIALSGWEIDAGRLSTALRRTVDQLGDWAKTLALGTLGMALDTGLLDALADFFIELLALDDDWMGGTRIAVSGRIRDDVPLVDLNWEPRFYASPGNAALRQAEEGWYMRVIDDSHLFTSTHLTLHTGNWRVTLSWTRESA
jgi:hypothetical protein